MADVITRLKVESSEYDSKIKRATQSLNEMTTAAERQGNKIATANKQNIALAQSLGKMQTVSTTARGKMSELSSAIEAATIQYNRLTAAEKQGQFGRALDASITKLRGRLAGLKNEMAAVQGQMGKTSMMGGMGGFGAGGGGGLSKIGGGFSKGIGGAAAMLGPAAAGAAAFTAAMSGVQKVVSDVISINKTFEQSTANLTAVMGLSRDEVKDLTTQAKQLGATTQYTASQILELQTNLARLGFTQKEILNSTSAVQALATATGADLGEAANLAGSALRGFGLNATEMERVASVLSVGTTKSALSFEKLATALPVVQTAAAKTGFTIEDTVAMLGKLTDNGINAASAATQLRKILNDSTTAGTKLANALGGPVKSFDELVVALDKAGKAGQNHADSVALVNSKNATALDILRDMAQQREVDVNGVKKQTSALQELRDSITDCSDGMKSMQDEQLNTLQGSITILNSAWEGLMLTFSESGGVLKDVVDWLTNAVQAFTKWRNIYRVGGDQAILQYEKGVTNETKKAADTLVKAYQYGGTSNEDIAAQYAGEKVELEKKKEALVKQLKLIDEENSTLTKVNKYLTPVNAYASMAVSTVETKVSGKEDLYKELAAVNDQIATVDYILAKVTEKPTPTTTTAGEDERDQEDKTKGFLQKRRAQIEAEEKLEISKLDRMAMAEEEYEKKVYEIKRAALEQIAKLYQEDTTERAKAEAAISSLDIQYQGTQMRLANKGKGSTAKPKEEKLLNYSQEGIANLGSQIKGAMSKSEIGSDGYLLAADQLLDFTTFENLLKAATERGVQPNPEWMASLFEDIKIGADIDDSTWQAVVDHINELIEGTEFPSIDLDVKTGKVEAASEAAVSNAKDTESAWQNAVAAVNNVGSALQSIEDPAAKVSGIVMQAVANIALGFAQAAASPATGAAGVFGWIAAATAGVATMVATIASIKSVTSGSYASGGIVPGSSFSGDNLTANVNSGELILNRAQQASIAGQLSGGATQTVVVEGRISGKDILLSANNTNRAAGGSRGYYTKVK